MKTREDMVYDFMLALTNNPEILAGADYKEEYAAVIYEYATALANKYIGIE
jgi:hypothetical protein